MDQDLEAGWQKLDEGKLDEAHASAEAALKAAPDSPEAYTLRGAVAAAAGDSEAAYADYERAMALDAEYVEPRLLCAELAATDGDGERARELCDEALDLAEEEDEYLDALLLKAEVELGDEDPDAAAATLAELPPANVALPSGPHHLRAAECFLELEDPDTAEAHYQAALKLDPDDADALYGLGLTAEARGDAAAQKNFWKQTAAVDRKTERAPWSVSSDRLEEIVEAALGELPERARTLLGNVPILVEDYPSDELIDDGLDPRLLGLFTGLPFPEQPSIGHGGAAPHLEHVLLFHRNIERVARSADEMAEQVRITLLHETGHFFGLDEEELAELGLD
jgi:predicted Zn-dependent protease with MMP-like domain/Flp pilus assembly protein TadD